MTFGNIMAEIGTQYALVPEISLLAVAGGVISLAVFMMRRVAKAGR